MKGLFIQAIVALGVVLATIMGTGVAMSAMQPGNGVGLHVTVLPAPTSPTYLSNVLSLSGIVSELHPPGGGGGGGALPSPTVISSPDMKVDLSIPYDTIIKDKDGSRIYAPSVKVQPNPDPPAPPESLNIIGLAYNFEPSGATFSPPITLTFAYDESKIPAGIDESSLVLAFYDNAAGKWVELECVVDVATNTITAKVAHFTTFAIIGHKPWVEPPVPPTPPEVVVPSVPTPPEAVLPPVVAESTPEQPVIPITPILPPSGFSGWIIVGAVVLVAIGGLAGYIIWKRKRVN